MLEHMKSNILTARAIIKDKQEKVAHLANKHRRHLLFNVGDLVWLTAHHLHVPLAVEATKKLAPLWYGPYKIAEVLSDVTYKLALPANIKIHPVVHVSHLKEHVGTLDPTQIRHPPQPEEIDGQLHYHVEALTNTRGKGNKTSFLVKWTGHSLDVNEWIPKKHLQEDLDEDTFKKLVTELEQRIAGMADAKRRKRIEIQQAKTQRKRGRRQ